MRLRPVAFLLPLLALAAACGASPASVPATPGTAGVSGGVIDPAFATASAAPAAKSVAVVDGPLGQGLKETSAWFAAGMAPEGSAFLATLGDAGRAKVDMTMHAGKCYVVVGFAKLGTVIAINHIRGMITAAANGMGVLIAPSYSLQGDLERGALVPLFPSIRPLEDRFSLYQKASKAGLAKHRLLKEYLVALEPSEFGV